MKLPEPIQNVADELSNLPSIGPRQAIRLAFYLVGEKTEDVHKLAVNINNLRKLKICKHCFFPHQNAGDLCDICGNPNRNQNVIMIVEKGNRPHLARKHQKIHRPLFHHRPDPKDRTPRERTEIAHRKFEKKYRERSRRQSARDHFRVQPKLARRFSSRHSHERTRAAHGKDEPARPRLAHRRRDRVCRRRNVRFGARRGETNEAAFHPGKLRREETGSTCGKQIPLRAPGRTLFFSNFRAKGRDPSLVFNRYSPGQKTTERGRAENARLKIAAQKYPYALSDVHIWENIEKLWRSGHNVLLFNIDGPDNCAEIISSSPAGSRTMNRENN